MDVRALAHNRRMLAADTAMGPVLESLLAVALRCRLMEIRGAERQVSGGNGAVGLNSLTRQGPAITPGSTRPMRYGRAPTQPATMPCDAPTT
jgi:hypothetical protein